MCACCSHPANNFTSSKWTELQISAGSWEVKNIKHCLVHMKERKRDEKQRAKPKNPTSAAPFTCVWCIKFCQAAEFIHSFCGSTKASKSFSDPPVATWSKVCCFQRVINLTKSCWSTRLRLQQPGKREATRIGREFSWSTSQLLTEKIKKSF